MYKLYAKSGQNDPSLWGSFSQGDTVVDYVFSLFRNNSLVLELANPEVGPSGVEGDDALETSNGTRAMTTSRGKRKREGATAALDSLVESSASMAASAATHTRCAEMVSLSTTLKNLRECHAAPNLIKAVEKQLEDVVLQRKPTSFPDEQDAPCGSSEEASTD